jgi:hypothetical protein
VIDALRSLLNARWAELCPGCPPIDGVLLAGADKDSASNVTFLLFDRAGRLAAVAKVARDSHEDRALAAEHSALRELRRSGASSLIGSVPEPLALERVGGRTVLLLSAIEGRPMTNGYYAPGHVSDPALVVKDFEVAASWLEEFQDGTSRGAVAFDEQMFDRWIGSTFERYRAEIGWSDAEDRLFGSVRERARALYGTPVPISGVHGDYWMGNILVEGGAVAGVVDWERASLAAPSFTDVYKFPTSYGFYLDRGYPGFDGRVPGHPERDLIAASWSRFGTWPNLIGFGYAYFGTGWFPSIVRRFVLGSLDRLDVPHDVNAVFFPAFLAAEATALRDEGFRDGYRSLLAALEEERGSSWLWTATVPA